MDDFYILTDSGSRKESRYKNSKSIYDGGGHFKALCLALMMSSFSFYGTWSIWRLDIGMHCLALHHWDQNLLNEWINDWVNEYGISPTGVVAFSMGMSGPVFESRAIILTWWFWGLRIWTLPSSLTIGSFSMDWQSDSSVQNKLGGRAWSFKNRKEKG